MRVVIAAIHGILTGQTDPSWPDWLDAWMVTRVRDFHVVKKEYGAGPFPRWNNWVRDPRLARGLASELELFMKPAVGHTSQNAPFTPPSLWLVAHSNGAVIALLAARRLIERGHKVTGLILTGAACEADIGKNGVLDWYADYKLEAAIAYSSREDKVVAGDARVATGWRRVRDWVWGRMIWPYGCLGRSGWMWNGQEVSRPQNRIFTRWFEGGHSCYFTGEQYLQTFEQIYQDIVKVEGRTQNAERKSQRREVSI